MNKNKIRPRVPGTKIDFHKLLGTKILLFENLEDQNVHLTPSLKKNHLLTIFFTLVFYINWPLIYIYKGVIKKKLKKSKYSNLE